MAQRSIEVLIGRLITDEAFRDAFLANRVLALQPFVDAGHKRTPVEVSAIHATPDTLSRVVAKQIDQRLQRAKLSGNAVCGRELPRCRVMTGDAPLQRREDRSVI